MQWKTLQAARSKKRSLIFQRLDMAAFFAAVEMPARPELKGLPVVIGINWDRRWEVLGVELANRESLNSWNGSMKSGNAGRM